MRRQPQVIVRRQVDDPLAIKRADRSLLVLEHPQAEVGALLLQVVELVAEIGKRIDASSRCHESLPRELAILTQQTKVLGALEKAASKIVRVVRIRAIPHAYLSPDCIPGQRPKKGARPSSVS